jgi:two-component system response regulator HydG
MIGRSAAMQQLFELLTRVAPHARTVLVTGEAGTGKDLVARALHRMGPRRDLPLVAVDCSAAVDFPGYDVLGHTRRAGAGAFERDDGRHAGVPNGTVFLDEVGELPLATQAQLLRALDRGGPSIGSAEARLGDAHVIAATHRDLAAESAAGRFRNDLFYRLDVVNVRLAPLRERREDIPLLACAFLADSGMRLNRRFIGISDAARQLLERADWPGNVRELRNVIARACLMTEHAVLGEREISLAISAPVATSSSRPLDPSSSAAAAPFRNPNLLSTAYRTQIERVLVETGRNKTVAAQMLGISRRSLYRWMERLELR